MVKIINIPQSLEYSLKKEYICCIKSTLTEYNSINDGYKQHKSRTNERRCIA